MVYGWKDKIMTDKLMHALSTMTEIALLWNPCSDLFLMDREPYVLPHVCPQKSTPKPSDDGHNSPPFRAAARLQRTCDEHARQDDSTAKLQARAACLWWVGRVQRWPKPPLIPAKSVSVEPRCRPTWASTGGHADPPTELRPAHTTRSTRDASMPHGG